jgi:hypothetical protein
MLTRENIYFDGRGGGGGGGGGGGRRGLRT